MDKDEKVQINVQIPLNVREDFRVVARFEGKTMSALLYRYILMAIREAKERNPALFGIENIPPHRSRFDVYAEALDAPEFSESEWQLMESYFKQHVETWKRFQRERLAGTYLPPEHKPLAPVVAHIGPGDLTKAEAQKMIDAVDIGEKRKRKTG